MIQVKPPKNPIVHIPEFTDVEKERREQKRDQAKYFGDEDDVEVHL